MNAPETQLPKVRLTEFSHGGGCGCKIAPAVLSEILASSGLKGAAPKDLLVGTEKAMQESFGSTCHGAGRVMSRARARKTVRGEVLAQQLRERGIFVRASSMAGLAEEAPDAYKDVDRVVNVVDRAGLAKRVARFKPLGVIKG
jgi:RNA-splicing ligase RtcB